MSELVVLVPVLRRPHRVTPLLDSLASTVPAAHVLFLFDRDDSEEWDAISRHMGRSDLEVAAEPFEPGYSYAQKINQGIRVTSEPLIFVGADDLDFKPGWFEAARERMTMTVGVVGTQDLGNDRVLRGEHATHSLVARWYAEIGSIDEADQLLHEGYEHNFCDTEFVKTAIHRGAFAFAHDSVVEHRHPLWGKAEGDATYKKGQESFKRDRRRYTRRRRLWTA